MLYLFLFMSVICLNFNVMHAITPNLEAASLKKLNLSIEEIDNIVSNALEKFNVPGASISIVFDDQVLLSKGYGFRDLNKKLPVTECTLFPIASCTKAFTALALGHLVEEGRIAFDDPVQKYIPEFYLVDRDRTMQVTIRDLLAHRTGIARHDPIWIYSDMARASIIELLKHFEPACDLRQDFQYNNFMYTLAGLIVERVTGQSWEEFLSLRLLKPLEMNNSATSLEELECSLDFSLPYAEINGIIKEIPFCNTFSVNPSGGIISNAEDMTNWLKLQLGQGKFGNDNFIQSQILEETHAVQMPLPFSKAGEKTYHIGYGLGWLIGNYREYDFISHGGDIDGFSSEVALLPEKRIGLVILTNSSTDGRYAISTVRNQIFDKILGMEDIDWTNKMQEVRKNSKNALCEALKTFNESCQIPYALSLEPFVGVYAHPAYGKVILKIENNNLMFSFGKMKMPIYFKSTMLFTGRSSTLLNYGINPNIDVKFFENSSNIVYKMEIPFEEFRSAKPITFIRIK